MSRTLDHEAARRVYDRIGARQDSQAFYEDRAIEQLLEHGGFERAARVFELGCGTGRLALRLLAEHLPEEAEYLATDLSPEMVRLARERLRPFGSRARVLETDGSLPIDAPDASVDRFVSTYVLDLLAHEEIEAVIAEARRLLRSDGRLCLAGLSHGEGALPRVVATAWSAVHRLVPALVGGCRPIELLPYLSVEDWRIKHHARLAPFGIPSEVVVAELVER